ncbi:MAG TPA: PQQ-dependent sugar dehydrogenase [Bacteroidia bacterium]|nr:PQQ-dependent sugar dehydrogenase [Bacteroidia bacterium]
MKKTLQLLLVMLCTIESIYAQPTLTFTTFSSGYSRVIDIRNCKDSRLFMVQQAGKIIVCDSNGVQNPTPFLNLTGICTNPSSVGDERGLLGMTFHPDYKNNGYFYVNYTAISGGATTIARYSVSSTDSNVADPSSATILLTITQPYSNHNGGCLAFGPDGYLYIGTGDGGSANDPGNRAQDKTVLLGKMLRIDVDNPQAPLAYGIPSDNPFVGTSNRGEIWTYGLRNPWKWSFDRIYGDMWIGDVGQNAWEEIDFEPLGTPGGRNYGWRCYEGNVTTPGVSQTGCPAFNTTTAPIAAFSHSATSACAVTGGYIYRGAKHASLYGYYIYTDYCDGRMRLTKNNYNGTFTTYDLGTVGGSGYFVAFGEDYRGEIYMADDFTNTIKKIGATGCSPTAAIVSLEDTIQLCYGDAYPTLSSIYHPENTYQWYQNGLALVGATSANLITNSDGAYTVEVTNPSACSTTSSVVHIYRNLLPAVSFAGLDTTICTIDAPLTLTGTPAGGTFSGTGMNGNSFDPAVAGAGVYDISYTYTNAGGCDTTVIQSIEVTICSGLDVRTNVTSMNLFPNPNEGEFTLELTANMNASVYVSITDITGKNVHKEIVNSVRGTNLINLNVSNLQKGFYMLKVSDAAGDINKSFVIR